MLHAVSTAPFAQTDVTFLSRIFGSRPPLLAKEKHRTTQWRALRKPDLHSSFEASRYVIVDVETSGLNPYRDSLIAIGAVAFVNGQILLNDAFEAVLRQAASSSPENILVHGIGGTGQSLGMDPAQALLDFLNYAGTAPLIGFHASFDEAVLHRAMKANLGINFHPPWLDIALLAPALKPTLAGQLQSLDDWTGHLSIGNFARHSALADAYSTAQLFLVCIGLSKQSYHAKCFADLATLEKAQRTLERLKETPPQ
ncbi:MAG: PolC-type DNA polymerase III [Thiobacillaceae bacterium]